MAEPALVVLPGPLGGHPGSVFTVAWSAGGMLASGGWDGTVRLWEPGTGTAAGVLTGHAGPVIAVAFGPDGITLASCGRDRTIRLWDTSAQAHAWLLRGHEGTVQSVAFAPGGDRLASAASDGTVRLWDLASGAQAGPALPDDARAVAFSPDGSVLASAGRDGRIRLRLADAGSGYGGPVRTLKGHDGPVLSVAFAPGGGRLASAGSDGTVRLWDLAGGTQAGPELPDDARAVAFSPDGRALASTGLDAGTLLRDLASGSRRAVDQARRCHGLAFSPDGTRLATAGDAGDIQVHDLAGGAAPVVLTGHVCEILSAACSPDGRLLATGDADGAIRIWSTADGSLARRLTGDDRDWVRSLAFSPGGTMLAAAVGTGIRRWATARRFPKAASIYRADPVTAVGFGTAEAGAEVLLSADAGGRLATWDTDGGALAEAGGAGGPVVAAAVSGDGSAIVSVDDDGVVRRWNRGLAGAQAFAPAVGRARCVAVSPDGQVLAAGGDGVVVLWNAASPAVAAATLTGHQGVVRALAFAPDGTLLASGADDATVRLWDTRSLVTARKLDGHVRAVRAVAFAPDSATLFSAGDDGRIFQWDARSGALLQGSLRPARPAPPTPGIRSDDPSRADWLGMRADAEMLATLITAASTQAPLAIALLGEWGAGKSSLMLQVSDEVDRKAGSGPDYVGSVCHVRFNAWHYSDDRVWTGLVGHLFRSLAAAASGAGEPPPQPETIRADSERLRGQLAGERRRYDRLVSSAPGGPALLAGEAWRRRGSLLLRALLTVAALGVGALTVLAGLTAAFARAGDWARSIDDARRQARKSRAEQAEEARQRVAALEDQLAQVDAAVRLAGLLRRQSDQDPYAAWRGLPGEVYRGLAELSADLESLRAQRQVDGQPGAGPLERIILYVDDLDRCPPARVVEVLAAVHLMLALPLFVVIVAVDPRWLLDALQHHYRELFARGAAVPGGFDPGDRPATPLDYLDKIFQIPFAVRQPSAADAAGFLASLLHQEPAGGGPGGGGPGGGMLAGGITGPAGPAPGAGDDGLVPPGPRPGPARPPSGGTAGDLGTDPAERPSPAVPGREAAAGGPGALILRPAETEFMVALGPLMTTPRAAKKLVNLYRLVRIGIPEEELPAFIGGGGYRVVQVLLAVLTALPDAAPAVFAAIRGAAPGSDIRAVIAGTGPPGERIAAILDDVRGATQHGMTDDIRDYQQWCPALARYSFYTRTLAGA